MQIVPYLVLNGNCREAFEFYAKCFRGTIEMMLSHGESPVAAQVPPEWHALVMHARLSVGGATLMGSDSRPGESKPAHGYSVMMSLDTAEEAERVFAELADGGKVTMPMGESFWAARFGMLVDRFGTPWMINGELRA
jgi:PhnB protein